MNEINSLLILGGSGLIGSACAAHFSTHKNLKLLVPTHHVLELLDQQAVDRYVAHHRPDAIILAAGMVGGIMQNKLYPFDFITTNLSMQLNCMQAAVKYDIQKFIFFASSCMYPKNCSQPMHEDALFTGLLEPTSQAYAVAKLAGVEMCLAYNRQYNKQRFIPVIPNTVYGPNDNFNIESGHVLPVLMARMHHAKKNQHPQIILWGSGKPRREFIHAIDVAQAIDCLLMQTHLPELPINIGSNADLSIADLATLLKAVTGYQGTIVWDTNKPDGAPQKLLNSHKLIELGWEPTIDLQNGLADLYQWYQLQEEQHAKLSLPL